MSNFKVWNNATLMFCFALTAVIDFLLVIKLLIPLWPRKLGTMFADNSQMGLNQPIQTCPTIRDSTKGTQYESGGFRDVSDIYLLHSGSLRKHPTNFRLHF